MKIKNPFVTVKFVSVKFEDLVSHRKRNPQYSVKAQMSNCLFNASKAVYSECTLRSDLFRVSKRG